MVDKTAFFSNSLFDASRPVVWLPLYRPLNEVDFHASGQSRKSYPSDMLRLLAFCEGLGITSMSSFWPINNRPCPGFPGRATPERR